MKLLSKHAKVPTKATPMSAGLDLYSAHSYTIYPMNRQVVQFDLAIAPPAGCFAQIEARSGLASKRAIDVAGGIIDEDFRYSKEGIFACAFIFLLPRDSIFLL